MISGAHVMIYSRDAEADRAFFRDILEFPYADAGHGWLIFGLGGGEAGFHPADTNGKHELYLMCDDLPSEIDSLRDKGVVCSPVQEERWGSLTTIPLPSGGTIGLYQPKHPTALSM